MFLIPLLVHARVILSARKGSRFASRFLAEPEMTAIPEFD
jgi:hypothetical protein